MSGPSVVQFAERRLHHQSAVAETRLAWLASLGISPKSAHQMGLDKWELRDDTWQVVANEAIRRRARMLAGQAKAGRHLR